jgi:hypothetical protein
MSKNESAEEWMAGIEEEKKRIKEWDVSDRLGLLARLSFMNGSMASSIQGWNSWFTNPMICQKLSEDQLKDLSATFEKLCFDLLDLDVKYTKIMDEVIKKAKAERAKVKAQIQVKTKEPFYRS